MTDAGWMEASQESGGYVYLARIHSNSPKTPMILKIWTRRVTVTCNTITLILGNPSNLAKFTTFPVIDLSGNPFQIQVSFIKCWVICDPIKWMQCPLGRLLFYSSLCWQCSELCSGLPGGRAAGAERALIDLHNRNENIPETLEITQLFLPDFHEI